MRVELVYMQYNISNSQAVLMLYIYALLFKIFMFCGTASLALFLACSKCFTKTKALALIKNFFYKNRVYIEIVSRLIDLLSVNTRVWILKINTSEKSLKELFKKTNCYPWVIIIITTAKKLQNSHFFIYIYNTLIKWKEKY